MPAIAWTMAYLWPAQHAKRRSMDQKLSYQKEELAINTVRVLAIDSVQKANSGHPGTAMALAPGDMFFGQNSCK